MSFFGRINLGEEALGGLAAGIVGTVIGFPLDTIKTRMQTSSKNGGGTGKHGMLHVARHLVQNEGVLSLYRGIAPPLISLSIINTMSFTSYTYFRETVYGGTNGWDIRNSYAGMTGAPLFGIVTTPENLIKTQMQVIQSTNPSKRFTSSFQCASTLVKEHGFFILYTGHGVNTVREAAFMGAYFYVYEGFRQELLSLQHLNQPSQRPPQNSTPSPSRPPPPLLSPAFAVPVAGGLAGATAWFFSFPLDCIRAGIQGRRDLSHIMKRSAIQVFQHLYQTKGILGLYAGVGPSIARAFLVSGSRFSAYEAALWFIRGGRDNKVNT